MSEVSSLFNVKYCVVCPSAYYHNLTTILSSSPIGGYGTVERRPSSPYFSTLHGRDLGVTMLSEADMIPITRSKIPLKVEGKGGEYEGEGVGLLDIKPALHTTPHHVDHSIK